MKKRKLKKGEWEAKKKNSIVWGIHVRDGHYNAWLDCHIGTMWVKRLWVAAINSIYSEHDGHYPTKFRAEAAMRRIKKAMVG